MAVIKNLASQAWKKVTNGDQAQEKAADLYSKVNTININTDFFDSDDQQEDELIEPCEDLDESMTFDEDANDDFIDQLDFE